MDHKRTAGAKCTENVFSSCRSASQTGTTPEYQISLVAPETGDAQGGWGKPAPELPIRRAFETLWGTSGNWRSESPLLPMNKNNAHAAIRWCQGVGFTRCIYLLLDLNTPDLSFRNPCDPNMTIIQIPSA